MSKGDKVGSILGALGGTATLGFSGFFGYLSADTLSQQLSSGAGVGDFGASTTESGEGMTEIADGNLPALTTVGGLLSVFSGSSSEAPDAIIEVFTHNTKPYSVVENKAKNIYDRYDRNHEPAKDEGVSLVTTDPAVTTLVNDIISGASSKEEILTNLRVLESIISSQEDSKVMSKRYGKN
ncbi:MAG: hypothetical protein IJO43_00030 [Bacilli bacterium]|nr:hypothetical protein [Bacilli bacterium]